MKREVQILSKHIIISSLCFNKKALFFFPDDKILYLEGKNTLLKNICGSKNHVFFQVFLRMAKVMQFFSAINNRTNNCACDGVFADGNTKSLGSDCL